MELSPLNERDERLARVQKEVARGEYVVNSQNVAAAILERIGATFSEDGMIKESRGGHTLMQALTFPRGA